MSTRSHDIAWAAPGPLLATGQGLGRPALLRFATDDFIERLQAVLAEAPARWGHVAVLELGVVLQPGETSDPGNGCGL